MEKTLSSDESKTCYEDSGVISEYDGKGLITLERKIYGTYLKKDGGSILDVGCYVGRVAFPLAQKGFAVFGIDLARGAIQRAQHLKTAKEVKNAHFCIANAAHLPFKNESFDYALLPYNTIEAIPSHPLRIAAMQEVCRTLKNGGYTLFSTHNRWHPKYLIGITLNEIVKVIVRIVYKLRFECLLFLKKEYLKQNMNTEYGSILWTEPGGACSGEFHFSTPNEIKELLKKSSLTLVERIPIMNHSPQHMNADVLAINFLPVLRSPLFYYVCKKECTCVS